MASSSANTIPIRKSKSRKSKRIRAANQFLSNISLDGNISQNIKKDQTKERHELQSIIHKEGQEIISDPNFLLPQQLRPKLLSSLSATNASDDDNYDITLQGSVSLERKNSISGAYNRSVSLIDTNVWASNVSHVSGRYFSNHQNRLRGKRIMICSARCVPYLIYSVLKYTQHETGETVDKVSYKLRRTSSSNNCDSYGIKGVDLGAHDKPVSYGHLLIQTCNLTFVPRVPITPRKNTITSGPDSPVSEFTISSWKSGSIGSNSDATISSSLLGNKIMSPRSTEPTGCFDDYDPSLLDDPELRSGRHRKVLHLSSFMVSIIEYAKPSQLKKDLNEQFKEKFPNMEITLSKLRSLKNDIVKLSTECSFDHSTMAFAIVYFEKLVLAGKINKINRKLVAGSCLLLAAKFNNDLNKGAVQNLINSVSDWFRISTKDLFLFEIQALIALEFNLHLPSSQITPHTKRLEYGPSFV